MNKTYKDLYSDLILAGDHVLTPRTIKKSSVKVLCQWIRTSIHSDRERNQKCCISNVMDGNNDGEIWNVALNMRA
jgi:hypothetical protein